MNKNLLLILLLFVSSVALAQSTRVRGRITDGETGEPIPFVNVILKGTLAGITTDFDGMYSLETREETSALRVSYVGYIPQEVPVMPNQYNNINIALQPENFELEEVAVTPGENPAHPLLRQVIKRKKQNNPDRLNQVSCETYTKMELDLTNLKDQFKNKTLQKNFGFIFNYIDTSVVTGQPYLPIMIAESSSDYYHRRSPSLDREVVKASRISGVKEDYTLSQFTGQLHAKVNFYDNFINIFDVKFVSPLNDMGLMYYKYFLVDSLSVNGRKTYKMRFHPKGLSVPVLDGEINIDSATYALQSAHVKMMKGVNVNWIRHLALDNENQQVNDSAWYPSNDKMFADFSLIVADSSKTISFLGHRDVEYSNVRIDEPIPAAVLAMDNNVIINKDILRNDEAYWDTIRPYQLSPQERQIYAMVDSVQNVPLYHNIYIVLKAIMGGYYETKYVGIGPYYKLISFNDIEGLRIQPGFRTTENFSKKIRLFGHVAYGTKDERWKAGGGFDYAFNDLPTSKLTMSYKHDLVQLGAGVNAFSESNLLGSLLSRGNSDRLCMVNQLDAKFEKEWRQGFSTMYMYQMRDIFSSVNVPFIAPSGESMSSIQTTEVGTSIRLSKDEIVLRYPFDKYSMGSDYPIVTLSGYAGLKDVLGGEYEYYKLNASIRYDLNVSPFGQSNFILNAGKLFGKVPYPLLQLHEGNATYFYDSYAFSCMDYYEFASDTWASLFYEHHFKGFFLGKIPLMKRLKWREVFTFKAVVGTLSDKNNGSLENTKAMLLFPEGMSSVSKPYFETGVGVENIFRVLRVDAVWRLTHRKNEMREVSNFMVNFGVKIDF